MFVIMNLSEPPAEPPETPLRRRALALTCGLLLIIAVIAAAAVGSLFVGSRSVEASEIAANFMPILRAVGDPLSVSPDLRVVSEQRIPRTLLAIAVGACLGVAGALIQGHTRNPLADPSIIGVSAGAVLAVLLLGLLTGLTGTVMNSVWAFLGAVVATIMVFSVANTGSGALSPINFVLSGAALSAVLIAFSTVIILSDSGALDRMRFWTIGAVNKSSIDVVFALYPLAALGLIFAFVSAPTLNLLTLGDDVASSLGVDPARARTLGVGLIAFLTAVATSAAGPIGFLGLVAPLIARALCGSDYRWVLPFSAAIGAALLLAADIAGRLIVHPGEIEAGIVIAFIGAPLFMVLIFRRRVLPL